MPAANQPINNQLPHDYTVCTCPDCRAIKIDLKYHGRTSRPTPSGPTPHTHVRIPSSSGTAIRTPADVGMPPPDKPSPRKRSSSTKPK